MYEKKERQKDKANGLIGMVWYLGRHGYVFRFQVGTLVWTFSSCFVCFLLGGPTCTVTVFNSRFEHYLKVLLLYFTIQSCVSFCRMYLLSRLSIYLSLYSSFASSSLIMYLDPASYSTVSCNL